MPIKPFIMDHPLIQHKLTWLRDKNTGAKEFRELVNEIATLMCYEATRNLPLEDVEIETPMGPAVTKVISGRKLAFVPILRAGMGMLDGVLALIPAAKVGAHRPLPGRGDRHPGGVLLQAPRRYCRAGCYHPGPHAGYRWFRH